ncbi:hypothetical protein [Bacillus velezensis]|uniref:hypothetical protein n=1 Tax=Bacillus velezensis TaxID=492670 RepID=UPI001F3479BF|nr:hypothetical protein [Bacillus velezensis]UJA34264.1 hypothetical protein L0961_10545 [Bacillus velezensis]
MPIFYKEINDLLTNWAANEPPIEDFTVENVLYSTGLTQESYEEVLRYLMSKSGFELIPLQMLICPEGDKVKTFPFDEPIDDEEVHNCWCGEEDIYDPENLILVFQFTEDFKQDALLSIKKKKSAAKRKDLALV